MIRTVELGEKMQESESALVHIKWSHLGVLRRFHLAEHEWNFAKLLERIRMLEPSFNDSLCYSDEDGDKIVFSTNSEMDEMLSHFKKLRVATIKIETLKKSPKDSASIALPIQLHKSMEPTKELCSMPLDSYVSFTRSYKMNNAQEFHKVTQSNRRQLSQMMMTPSLIGPYFYCQKSDNAAAQTSPTQNAVPTGQAPRILHPNILCDQCDMQVMGIRYKCLTCDDYDLCELCEKSGMHAEHPMLRLANPNIPKTFELFHRSGRHHHQLRHLLREQRQEARRSCGGKGSPFTKEMLTKMMERSDRLMDLHTASNGSRPSVNAPQPAPAASVSIPKPNSQSNLYPSLVEESREFPPQPEHVPGANHRFQERINFLKGIGTQIQESLLNFGVECEATVEDNRGRVHGRVPMPNGRRTPPGPSHRFPHMEKKSGEHKSSKRRIDEEEVLIQKLNKCTMESQNKEAKESGEQPKKSRTEDEEKAAQKVAEQTAHESLSAAIQVATTETIQKASQVALEALSAATEIIGSLDKQAGQSTNKIGKDVLGSAINGAESLSTSISPIIADLVEKCKSASASPSPNSTTPVESAESQTFQAGPSKAHPYNSNKDMIDDLVAYIASLNAKPAETAIVIDQEHEIEVKDQATLDSTPMEVEQLVDFDSDVEVIQDNSTDHQPLPAANTQVNATLSSVSSCSGDSEENQCHMDSDDDWMLVSKSSYKQLCDFYEQKRKQQELKEKEEAERAMKPESSVSMDRHVAAMRFDQCFTEATMPALSSTAIPLPYFGTVPSAPAPETVTEPAVHLSSSDHSSPNKLYPSVEKEPEPEKCYAGMPFYTIQKPHNKKCYVRHKDLVVQGAVDQLEAMGYDNCNGWLTRLSERFYGDIPSVMDAALQDPLYLARMTD